MTCDLEIAEFKLRQGQPINSVSKKTSFFTLLSTCWSQETLSKNQPKQKQNKQTMNFCHNLAKMKKYRPKFSIKSFDAETET